MASPSLPESPSASATSPQPHRFARAGLWLLGAVLIVAVVELGAHLWQTHSVVPESDWTQASAAAKQMLQPSDGLAFAPTWTEPLGRMHFGGELATIARMAPPDYQRFERVLEVSIRGKNRQELEGWQVLQEHKTGAVRLRMLRNPAPLVPIDDLTRHVQPQALAVVEKSALDNSEHPCSYVHQPVRSGGLGFGPTIPSARFACPSGSIVALTVVTDLEYRPHQCIYATPPGGRRDLRLRFASVRFGKTLRGHHGLYVEAERMGTGSSVELHFTAEGRELGRATHSDGQGWREFAFDTGALANTTGELTVDVSSANGDRRMYCFEATTVDGAR